MGFRKRIGSVAVAGLLIASLSGCSIVTVLDVTAMPPEHPQELPFGFNQVEALPGGGMVAMGCGTLGSFGGIALVVVPGEPVRRASACGQEPGNDLAVGPDGTVYLAGYDWSFESPGVMTLDPVTLEIDLAYDVWADLGEDASIQRIDVDDDGSVYIGVWASPEPPHIVRVTGPASSEPVPGTTGLGRERFVVHDGTVVAVDRFSVVAVDPAGVRFPVAGTGVRGFSGDGGPAVDAQIGNPTALDVTADGALLIADPGNGRIRRVGPDGTIATIAGGGTTYVEGAFPTDVAIWPLDLSIADDGCVLVADPNSSYDEDGAAGFIRAVGVGCG